MLLLSGVVVRVLDLRLEITGSIPAAVLFRVTFGKLFTHISRPTRPSISPGLVNE